LRQIWEELQRHLQYRGRTTLIVTVDHGRGRAATMAHLLGVDYREQNPDAVRHIRQLFERAGDRSDVASL
jgi:hypothetical protein